jgi:hypothetical protein
VAARRGELTNERIPRDPAAPTWTIEARREAYRADGYETDSRDYLEGKRA